MIAGSGPLSQAGRDALDDRGLPDVDDGAADDEPKLLSHEERLAT
jgi:hypothetical protein